MTGVESGDKNSRKLSATEGQSTEKQGNIFEQWTENLQKQFQQLTNPHQSKAHKLADNRQTQILRPEHKDDNGRQEANKPVENRRPKTLREQAVEADQKIHNEIHKLTEHQVNVIHKKVGQAKETIQNDLMGFTLGSGAKTAEDSFKRPVATGASEANYHSGQDKPARNEANILSSIGGSGVGSIFVPLQGLFHKHKPDAEASQAKDSNGESSGTKQGSGKEVKNFGLAGALGAAENVFCPIPDAFVNALGFVHGHKKSDDTTRSVTTDSATNTAGAANQSDEVSNLPGSSQGNSIHSGEKPGSALPEDAKPTKSTGKDEISKDDKGQAVEAAGASSASNTDHSLPGANGHAGGDHIAGSGPVPAPSDYSPESGTAHGGKPDPGVIVKDSEQKSAPATGENGGSDSQTRVPEVPGHGANADAGHPVGGAPSKDGGKDSKPDHNPTGLDSKSSSEGTKLPENPITSPEPKPTPGGDSKPTSGDAKTGSEPKPSQPGDPKSTAGASDAHPIESKPTESRPTESKPTESKPTESKPTELKPIESKPTGGDSKPIESSPPIPTSPKSADSSSADKQSEPASKNDAKADSAPVQYAKSAGASTNDSSAAKDVIMPAKQVSSMARSSVDAVMQVDQALQKLLYAKAGDNQSGRAENAPTDLAGARNDNKSAQQDGRQIGDGRAIAFAEGKTAGDGRSLAEARPLADGKAPVDAKQPGEVRPVDGKAGEARVPELKVGDLRPADKGGDARAGEGGKDNRAMTPDGQGKGEPSPRRQEGGQVGSAGRGDAQAVIASPVGRGDGQAGTAGALGNEPRIFGGKGPGDDNTNKNSPIEPVNNNHQQVKTNDAHDGTRKESTVKHAGTDGKSLIDGGLSPLIPFIAAAGGSGGSDYTGIAGGGKNIVDNGAKTTKKVGRRKYTIKFGDTLERIAASILKDKRYASLLMTINRATLKIIHKDGRAVVQLLVGEQIWLPAETEMEVHRQAFFVDSASAGKQSPAGNKPADHKADTLPKPGKQVAASANAPSAKPLFAATPQGQTWISVSKITETCQILIADPGDTDTVFSIRLQVHKQGQWVTIAAYESHFGKNVRYVYRQDGSRVPFRMDLPAQVIKSMAKEDFASHWRSYEKAFLLNDLKYL